MDESRQTFLRALPAHVYTLEAARAVFARGEPEAVPSVQRMIRSVADTARRAGYPDISQIIVDFVPNAMNLTITTTGGVVGVVRLELTQAQGFTTFNITSVTVNGAAAPASYLTIINRDLPAILTAALDNLVTERFGSLVDVQTMTIDNSTLVIDTAP